jgi:hypothetical protein
MGASLKAAKFRFPAQVSDLVNSAGVSACCGCCEWIVEHNSPFGIKVPPKEHGRGGGWTHLALSHVP